MRRKKERSKQGQTNKQGKATQHTQGNHFFMYVYLCQCRIGTSPRMNFNPLATSRSECWTDVHGLGRWLATTPLSL